MAVVAGMAGLFWLGRRSRPIAFASTWLLVPLAPLLNLRAFVEDDFAHDRYLYLPSVGFAILVALALRRIPGNPMTKLGLSAAQAGITLVLALLMIFDVVYQSYYFVNEQIFCEHNARMAPNNPIAKNNLAVWLYDQEKYDMALVLFKEVAAKHPRYWFVTYNVGMAHYKTGRLAEAEQDFARAIRIDPDRADAHARLGMTMFRMNRVEDAERSIRRAIQIWPTGKGYHFALGMMLKTRGDLRAALTEFKIELVNFPSETAAREQVIEIEERLKQAERGE
jgi:tetratricopeptide (TPR) repeat protein